LLARLLEVVSNLSWARGWTVGFHGAALWAEPVGVGALLGVGATNSGKGGRAGVGGSISSFT
jgi:hypothetical protein